MQDSGAVIRGEVSFGVRWCPISHSYSRDRWLCMDDGPHVPKWSASSAGAAASQLWSVVFSFLHFHCQGNSLSSV